jgi:tetratricopeptide (TPR) repeat protein
MLSEKPSQTQTSKPDPGAFLKANQEPLEQLITFLDFAPERLTLGFVSVNFSRDREILIDLIRQDDRCQDIQLVVFHFPDPELRFLRDALLKELSTIQREPNKKLVLMITGLEHSIGMLGEYPLVLQDLNYVRDAFTSSVPYPILVCLPDSALSRLARYAPDFWAWRTAVFQFKSSVGAVDSTIRKILGDSPVRGLADKCEAADLLLRLLNEYPAAEQLENLEPQKTRLRILIQLGKNYYSRGEVEKAKNLFEEVLQLSTRQKDWSKERATALNQLGILQEEQGNVEEATTLYEQSLEIKERIGDVKGKATTLSNIAGVIADQGDIDRALELWQQSLEIKERLSDIQGKAATLNNMTLVIAQQGDIDRALELWQQDLEISKRIGDVKGKAITLMNMAYWAGKTGNRPRESDLNFV